MKPIKFISGCPVAGCKNNNSQLTWTHSDCGAEETIDSEGVVNCNKGHKLGEFYILKYKCGGHDNGFQFGNYSAFAAALSVVANMHEDFAAKLTAKLLNAYTRKELPGMANFKE